MRALAALLVLAACTSHDPPTSPGPPPSKAPPAPPAPTDRCADLHARYDAALARAPGTCAADAECACYPGGLGAHPTCGGVVDRASADTLTQIAAEFAQRGCSMSIQCAASVCAPRCEHGHCR